MRFTSRSRIATVGAVAGALAVATLATATAPSQAAPSAKKAYTVTATLESGSVVAPRSRLTVTGKVTPKARGSRVELQIKDACEGWTTIKRATLNKKSRYSIGFKAARFGGTDRYRVRKAADKSGSPRAATSKVMRVRVDAPPPAHMGCVASTG